jgi:multiple sugar transport system substrate-binding protein
MRQRLRSLVLVALLITLPLTAFSGATSHASTRLGGTIQFMTWSAGPAWLPAFKKLAAGFMKQNPGTTVQVIVLPYDTWTTKFPLLAATHTEPDVFQQDTSMWKLYNEGIAADLRPYIATDHYFNNPTQFFTHSWASVPSLHGQVTAAPIAMSVMVLYYNRNLFAKSHLAMPTDSWTWDDFLKAAQLLTLDNKGRNALDKGFDPTNIVQYGFDPSSMEAYWGYWAPIWGNGGDIFDHNVNPTKCTLDQPPAVKGLKFVADLITRYHVAPSPSQAKALGGASPFATGKVAMSYDGDWSFATYESITSFKWDVTLPPLGPKGRKNTFWATPFSIGRDSKNKALAWAFIRYLAEDKTAQQEVANLGVGIPVRVDVAKSPAFLHPSWAPPHYSDRLLALDGARFGEPLFPGWSEVQTRYWNPVQDKLWRGQVTAAQAAQQICSNTDAFLKTVKY